MKYELKELIKSIPETVLEFSIYIAYLAIGAIFLITLPIWIIPYIIYMRRKK